LDFPYFFRPTAVHVGVEVIVLVSSISRRKPRQRARPERLEARISRDQKALFQRAAELQGRTLTDFVISSAHQAAVRTVEEMQIIRLSASDSRAFAGALINPRKPTEKLRAAARRYMQVMSG
jgi:uncharacterized protein (DUF1778 family)